MFLILASAPDSERRYRPEAHGSAQKTFEKEQIFHGSVILSEAKNLWPFNLQAEILRRLLLLRMTK